MKRNGMTLIEVMVAMSIFTAVMGVLLSFAIAFGDTAEVQGVQATGNDEARRAMGAIIPDLRQAFRSSIDWGQLPGDTIAYRVPTDLDGNGSAVDINGELELSLPHVIGRDTEDVNGDGFTVTQLAVTNGITMRVLANELVPESEQLGEDGVFDPADDLNGNGRLDRGVWFEVFGRGVRVTVQTQGTTRKGHVINTTLQELVFPRN
jgi:prepilin-type N-terminal cleavage/methylation domain-containing protein